MWSAVTPWLALVLSLLPAASAPRAALVALDPARPLSPQERSAVESVLHVAGFQALDPVDAAALEADPAQADTAAPPDALFVEARRALLNFDEASAQRKLEQARATLCESPRILAERTLLADIHLLTGQIEIAAGRDVEARREFALAAVIEPTRTLHPGLYPPDVVAAYQQAQRERGAAVPGALVVEAEPAEAQIYLDGDFRGPPPLVVPELAAGLHYVTAVVQGRAARTRVVEVASGHSTQLALFVPLVQAEAPVATLLAAYRALPRSSTAAEALLAAIGADLVLALADDRGAVARRAADRSVVALEVLDPAFVAADPGQRTQQLVEASDAAVRERIPKAIASTAPAQGASSVSSSAPDGDQPWPAWVWVTAGAAGSALIAASAVAVGIYIVSLPPPAPPADRVNIVIGGPSQ